MDIQDRIAVVTGAASGIGRALCLALAEAGAAHVVCADLNGDGAAATASSPTPASSFVAGSVSRTRTGRRYGTST